MDGATVAGVAALVVAIAAMIVALAQALQQYLITGQRIRLCDSVVYGPMPGQGRRVWEMSQFRFRVLYSMPQISLESRLWGSGGGAVRRSYAIGEHTLPYLETSSATATGAAEAQLWSGTSPETEPEDDRRHVLRRRTAKPDSWPERGLEEGELNWTSLGHAASETKPHRGKHFRSPRREATEAGKERVEKGLYHNVPTGEASWVSFCRAVEQSCGGSIRVDYMACDVDRCPSDLVSAPMPTSMRDIVIMGLKAGMVITRASFEEKSVSMQGPAGSLTSASHPVLGPILHFSPSGLSFPVPHALGVRRTSARGAIDGRWLARILDVPSVANKYYHWVKRRTVRRLDERWIKDHKNVTGYEIHVSQGSKKTSSAKGQRTKHSPEQKSSPTTDADKRDYSTASGNYRVVEHKPADGAWSLVPTVEVRGGMRTEARRRAEFGRNTDSKGQTKQQHSAGTRRKVRPANASYKRPMVEDADDEGEAAQSAANETMSTAPADTGMTSRFPGSYMPAVSVEPPPMLPDDDEMGRASFAQRRKNARKLQAARAEKINAREKDRFLVQESVKQGAMTSPYEEAAAEKTGTRLPLLLAYHPASASAHDPPNAEEQDAPPVTDEAYEARQREKEREEARLQRDEARHERNLARNQAMRMTNVDVFWLSQVDITSGQWVTPWHITEYMPLTAAATGGITVILEALLGFLNKGSLLYTGSSMRTYQAFQETAAWMLDKEVTSFPAYALNARGGVIAQGTYLGVEIPVLEGLTPALQLLHSYEWQVSALRNDEDCVDETNVELMRIDAWLSYVGRTDQIINGPQKLLKQTPALIALILVEHELDFQNIDLSAEEGGWQDIAEAAASLMDTLMDEQLNEAEQLYILVALLRTLKVVQSVWAGSDSYDLQKILELDIQVHLV